MSKDKKERKHNFVVGFDGENQCVYGKDYEGALSHTDPLTLFQAKQMVKRLHKTRGFKRTIYQLVKTSTID